MNSVCNVCLRVTNFSEYLHPMVYKEWRQPLQNASISITHTLYAQEAQFMKEYSCKTTDVSTTMFYKHVFRTPWLVILVWMFLFSKMM